MKRIISLLLTIILALGLVICPVYAAEPVSFIKADSYLAMDMTTGKILTSCNADERRYPASTTKMLTAILALENLDPNKVLTADADIVATIGSRYGFYEGEQMTVKDAVNTMLIVSANDIAILLAKAVSGSVTRFADLMNEKAASIGCQNSHFVNPNGLHDDNHYSTAYDLAQIALYCMKNPTFRAIVCQQEYTLANGKTFKTNNWLINDESHAMYVRGVKRYPKYEGCIGIKTGSTPEAGGCLVAAATRGETTILTVILHSPDDSYTRVADSIALLDWAFDTFETFTVMSSGTPMGTIPVKRGSVGNVDVVLSGDIYDTLPKGTPMSSVRTEVNLEEFVMAPVEAGTVVGSLSVYENDKLVGKYDIVAAKSVEKGGILSIFGVEDARAKKIFKTILYVLLGLIAAFICFCACVYITEKRKRAKRKAEKRAKKAAELSKVMDWDSYFQAGSGQDDKQDV